MKVKFPFEVKYKGKHYTANKPFEIEAEDTDELVSLGGVVIEKSSLECLKQSKNCNKANNRKLKRGINNDST